MNELYIPDPIISEDELTRMRDLQEEIITE